LVDLFEYCGNIKWFAVWQHNLLKREKQKNGNCVVVTATYCCFDWCQWHEAVYTFKKCDVLQVSVFSNKRRMSTY